MIIGVGGQIVHPFVAVVDNVITTINVNVPLILSINDVCIEVGGGGIILLRLLRII